jgi:hypothetical protein
MQRIWEFIFGLDRGFFSRPGEFSFRFNPSWPWQETIGAGAWNFLLVALALALVVYIYRREGRTRGVKIALGVIRAFLLLFVIALLNRPVVTLGQNRTEASILAIMIDDSVSMRVRDAGGADDSISRLEAATQLLNSNDQALLKRLSRDHQLRLYRFSRDAEPMISATQPSSIAGEGAALQELKPEGQQTQVLRSLRSVLDELQGQRLAGVVMISDGREAPASPLAEALAQVKDYGAKVFPIAIGSEAPPRNVEIQAVTVQDTAFKGDIINVRATLRATGLPAGQKVAVQLKDKKTGAVLPTVSGASEVSTAVENDQPVEVELPVKANEVGPLDLIVEALKIPGELDDEDNTRTTQIAVLDAKINVLYVDGYPRWEYRYIKNEMIRDDTVNISCLLFSADPTFRQEGDIRQDAFPGPITRFPESIEEIMAYDVVLFGDVDPQQFSDMQLQLVSDFVSKRGGGFGMVAGTQHSPQAFRNTAKFLAEQIQPIFWYCRNVSVKPGVGEALAVHPTDVGPDGRKSPILVLGRFGAGRTLFSAIDDSWRWRFYTGESIFDTYWVQQIRYLARSKKLGQRRLTLTTLRPSYELGQQIRISLRILDPKLLTQLPEQLRIDVVDAAGQLIRQETLVRQEGQPDLYVATWAGDRVGRFSVRLGSVAGGIDPIDVPIEVAVPRLELAEPQVDRTFLTRLASETNGQPVALHEAAAKLPELVPSAARTIPLEVAEPLWDAPIALVLFVLLITFEWVMRKMYGMV